MLIDLSNDGILIFLKNQLEEAHLQEAIIYREGQILRKGTRFPIGRRTFILPFDAHLVFVDLEPKANWGHPCTYFFIDTDGNNFEKSIEMFPPYTGNFPDTWIVIQRYGEKPPHDRYFQIY